MQNRFFSKIPQWYWLIIILEISLGILLFLPEIVPIIWIRYGLGAIFVLYVPGYAIVRSLYAGKTLDNIEQSALSIGLSLSLVPVIGFILDLTPWRIGLATIVSTLMLVTIGVSTLALYQERAEVNVSPDRKVTYVENHE